MACCGRTLDRVFDVVVAGGGPAGFIAAIASARGGSKTALVEQYDYVGGLATAGLVAPISVFGFANTGRKSVGGIPWEFVERLEAEGGAIIEKPKLNISFDPELYKLVAQRMLLEAGVTIYHSSQVLGCTTLDGRISEISIVGRGSRFSLQAKAFIDATGDAVLAHAAGVPMLEPQVIQQPFSLYFMLTDVDTDTDLLRDTIHHTGKEGLNAVSLTIRNRMIEDSEREGLPMFGGPWFCATMTKGTIFANVTRASADAMDVREYSDAALTLREDVQKIFHYFKKTFPEFSHSSLVMTAPQVGIRESRHIKGLHVLTGEEYTCGMHFEDTVSMAAHPIDIHDTKSEQQQLTSLKRPGSVPYGSLIPEGMKNLLVAGRCISADSTAFASLRVQAPAMATGEAAGTAAALMVKDGCDAPDVDRTKLCALLREHGAIIDYED